MSALPVVRDDFVRLEVCAPCGGRCCKHAPGAALPEDVGAPDETAMRAALTEKLKSGLWSIDWWEGDPRSGRDDVERAYFVRPATKRGRGRVFDASWGGQCAFLRADGCSIFDSRPTGCRGVEPSASGRCEPRYASKQDCASAWLPYTDLLLDVARSLDAEPWEGEPDSGPGLWGLGGFLR